MVTRRNFLKLIGAAIIASAVPVVPDVAQIEQSRVQIRTIHMTAERLASGELKFTTTWHDPTGRSTAVANQWIAKNAEWQRDNE